MKFGILVGNQQIGRRTKIRESKKSWLCQKTKAVCMK